MQALGRGEKEKGCLGEEEEGGESMALRGGVQGGKGVREGKSGRRGRWGGGGRAQARGEERGGREEENEAEVRETGMTGRGAA